MDGWTAASQQGCPHQRMIRYRFILSTRKRSQRRSSH
ncbi:hypothetical protein OESDEN_14250 [Oesophagostomum dentatum]|uniref:Uncharacterized protein n=1 Tax=Oesophagostomum dentatum TaxID=61180 RepID=A0A0B1SQ42_OESDE|nr:hypothetical protein OESDEN_14250 [Oesophagostomum dentatum]